MIVAAGLIAIAALILSLWRERRRMSRALLAWLAVLRLVAVALIMAGLWGVDIAALLRPRPSPAVVLIVDESQSMSLRDGRDDDRRQRAGRTADKICKESGISASRMACGGDYTDLGAAVAAGARRAPDALVLLSDGNHNQGAGPVPEAVNAGIPVYAIGFGPLAGGIRPVIGDIAAPDQVEIGEPFTIRAAARGGRGRISWTLSENGRIVARAAAPAGTRSATMTALAAVPGLHRYNLAVSQDGEIGDSRGLTVLAVKSRITVIWIDLAQDWNLRFAAQALATDPAVKLETVVRTGGHWRRPHQTAPILIDSMLAGDVLAVSGGDGSALTPELEQFINRRVLQQGGGVLLIGDVRPKTIALPLKFAGQKIPLFGTVMSHPGWRQSGLFAAADTTAALIRQGPPMSLTGRLAVADSTAAILASVRTAQAEIIPLWAWRYAGTGRIMQFASADFWKWKMGLAGAYRDTVFFDQLIVNTVRWLAGRENSGIRIGTGRQIYSTAEKVEFRGRWQGYAEQSGGSACWNITISGPGGFRRAIVLSDWGSGDYAAEIGVLKAGTYDFHAVFSLNGRMLGNTRGKFFVEPARDESQGLTQNRELLQEIAAASGGRYFDADSLPPGAAWLRSAPLRADHQRRGEHLLLLVLLTAGLLAAEWMIRRRYGLR